MNKLRWMMVPMISAIVAMPLGAQDALDAGRPFDKWRWFQTVTFKDKAKDDRYALILPPSVLGKAMDNLQDLMLVDAAGKDIPYALRILRSESRRVQVPQRSFNAVTNEKQRYAEVSFELMVNAGQDYNQITIQSPGMNYRRRVEVMVADTEKFKDQLQLLNKHLVSFEADTGQGQREIGVRSFTFQPSQYRFLKVRVYADPATKEETPTIGDVTVYQTIRQEGKTVELRVAMSQPEPTRRDKNPATAWIITLNSDPVPISQLHFQTPDRDIDREYRLENLDAEFGREMISSGRLRSWGNSGKVTIDVAGGGARGSELSKEGQVDYDTSRELRLARLRLVVIDYANPPLTLTDASYSAAARQLIFDLPRDRPLPIRLFYGNQQALETKYDYARKLPRDLPNLVEASFADNEAQVNPAYEPPPPTLAERAPWLIYVALGGASLILLALLGLLAREAIKRHDGAAVPAQPG